MKAATPGSQKGRQDSQAEHIDEDVADRVTREGPRQTREVSARWTGVDPTLGETREGLAHRQTSSQPHREAADPREAGHDEHHPNQPPGDSHLGEGEGTDDHQDDRHDSCDDRVHGESEYPATVRGELRAIYAGGARQPVTRGPGTGGGIA